jgi:hypothetical protein
MTTIARELSPFDSDEDAMLGVLEQHFRTSAALQTCCGHGSTTALALSPECARTLTRCIARGRRAGATLTVVRYANWSIRIHFTLALINAALLGVWLVLP